MRLHLALAGLELALDLDQLRVVPLHALADAADPLAQHHRRLCVGLSE